MIYIVYIVYYVYIVIYLYSFNIFISCCILVDKQLPFKACKVHLKLVKYIKNKK